MNLLILFVTLAARAAAPNVWLVPAAAAPASTAAVQVMPEAQPVAAAVPRHVAVYPRPLPGTPCSLHNLFTSRFLSGPWSAFRRLEAARRRGDEAEMRRMETTLNNLFEEALTLGI